MSCQKSVWSGTSSSAGCVMEGVVKIHPLVHRHDCCSLRKKRRQAFAQAVPPTWNIFSSHHSFVKVKYHPLCGTILRQIWFSCAGLYALQVCTVSHHSFPVLPSLKVNICLLVCFLHMKSESESLSVLSDSLWPHGL